MGVVIVVFLILLIFFPTVLSNMMNIGAAILVGIPLALIVLLLLNWAFNDIMGFFK
jgi:hypothetical protein